MANSPVQVVLNADNFVAAREGPGFGGGKDFYVGRDRAFVLHRQRVRRQIERAANALSSDQFGGVGYAKVRLERSALAKSHRPLDAIFKPEVTPLVGSEGVGELIVEVTPETLTEVCASIDRAEETVESRPDKEGVPRPRPTRGRTEVGAIEQVQLWEAADKRRFSAEQAVEWLNDPRTGGAYRIELFLRPVPRSDWDARPRHRRMLETFEAGLRHLGPGLVAQRIESGSPTRAAVTVRLGLGQSEPLVQLEHAPRPRNEPRLAEFDSNIERHGQLLHFLDEHPLVRSVELSPRLVQAISAPGSANRAPETPVAMASRHPKVGIIDGGIGKHLAAWIVDRSGVLADEDRDEDHGTFIGGLLVAGKTMNPSGAVAEPDGCQLFDVDIFPTDHAFGTYYPHGVTEFFDELEAAVAEFRNRYGVRVFNLSINATQLADMDRYSVEAGRLDAIADKHDVIIVVSAGNLRPGQFREEWTTDATQVLASLAVSRNDLILVPAESVRSVAVSALNPPGHGASIALAPASYSRRGPGLRAGVKPDVAHVGGAGLPDGTGSHGLVSCRPDGTSATDSGTSYAAPQVAKTLALLESCIEGEVSRETMIALLVHHSSATPPLLEKALKRVSRDLVGFGLPMPAEDLLTCADHEITLVFATRLLPGKDLVFPFVWPASLVGDGGRCRGQVRMTLVATPPLDHTHKTEFVRINLDAYLQQDKDGKWVSRLEAAYLSEANEGRATEEELIEHALKWSPTKTYARRMPRGVGTSSTWRLKIGYLTRAKEDMPADGVPFTAILTISDPDKTASVFAEARQSLLSLGVQTADIHTAARIVPRV